MPTKKDGSTLVLQAVVHRDVNRKLEALAEKMSIRPSAVVSLAISRMADDMGITLKEEVDPRQTSIEWPEPAPEGEHQSQNQPLKEGAASG